MSVDTFLREKNCEQFYISLLHCQFVISRTDTFPLKIFSKSKKKLYYIGKKYFSYSESVSQLVFWKFNGDEDSNLFPDQIRK